MVKINLKSDASSDFDIASDEYFGTPMVVRRKNYVGDDRSIVITTIGGCVYFHPKESSIFYSGLGHLKLQFEFVRFLSKGDSVTFTGEK